MNENCISKLCQWIENGKLIDRKHRHWSAICLVFNERLKLPLYICLFFFFNVSADSCIIFAPFDIRPSLFCVLKCFTIQIENFIYICVCIMCICMKSIKLSEHSRKNKRHAIYSFWEREKKNNNNANLVT